MGVEFFQFLHIHIMDGALRMSNIKRQAILFDTIDHLIL